MSSQQHLAPHLYQVAALLFDLDGTLVDSSAIVHRTWGQFAARHGLLIAEVLAYSHGRRALDIVNHFTPNIPDPLQVAQQMIIAETYDVAGACAIGGAPSLLEKLSPASWAIVTSATKEAAINRLRAVGITPPRVFITAEDVKNGKPSPDGYLQAAKHLNVDPKACMIFEDAPAGLLAAKAAGGTVIAVGKQLVIPNCYAARIKDFKQISITRDQKDDHYVVRLSNTKSTVTDNDDGD